MGDLIQLHGGTFPILNALNHVPAEREVVLELDTGRFKVGDGVTAWADLPYKLIEFILTETDSRYATVSSVQGKADLIPRDQTYTTRTNLTPASDSADIVIINAQAGALSILVPSGTPHDGQRLTLRIKDNGTARAVFWDSIYRAVGVTLPTTTVISKLLYVEAVYNETAVTWDCVRVAQES